MTHPARRGMLANGDPVGRASIGTGGSPMTANGQEPTRQQLDQARREIVEAAAGLVRASVLSPSQHGNISVRLKGTDLMLLTGVSSLANVTAEGLALLRLDGSVVDGEVHPASAEILRMHTEVYRKRDD